MKEFYPLSFSSLSRFAESPLSFLHYKTADFEQTPAMKLGTLVHRKVLEPAEYAQTVVVFEGRRSGPQWREFAAENVSRDIVTTTEHNKIEAIADSIAGSLLACDILDQCPHRELEVKWTRDGVPHRGFVDAFGSGCVVDLKVTVNVSAKDIQRMVYDRRYYMQAAMYMDGLNQNGHDVKHAYIIAVQSAAPHHVRVCHLPSHYLVRGHDEWGQHLERFKDWDGKGHHSHDGDEITTIDAPAWAPIPAGMTK